jgi:hypothetical protein
MKNLPTNIDELINDFKILANDYLAVMEGDGDPEATYELLHKYSIYDPRAGGPEDYETEAVYDLSEEGFDDDAD